MAENQKLNMKIVSKLMKNYETGSPVRYDTDIATAKDQNGNTMFFSIGSDGHLYMIQKTNGSETGWDIIDISKDLGADVKTKHIATAQDTDGSPILASVFYSEKSTDSQSVYFTKNFTPDAGKDRWVFRGNKRGISIDKITTGSDKNGNVVIAIASSVGNKMTNYLVNPNLNDSVWLWKEIPVPVNGNKVIDFSIGHLKAIEKIKGVDAILYMLLDLGDNKTNVIMTSLPDFTFYNHIMPVDFSPTSIGLVSDENGESELFIGEKNLYNVSPKVQLTQDENALKNAMINIGEISSGHAISKIIGGRYQDGNLEAWMLTDNDDVYLAREQSQDTWGKPYPLFSQIGQITCYRYASNDNIDFFYVNLDNELYYIYQDTETTRWKKQHIIVPDLNNTTEINTYTSGITVSDSYKRPVSGKVFVIKASEDTIVQINGKKYFVGRDIGASVKTNALGEITVVNKVNSMVSPIIRLEADNIEDIIDLDPNEFIRSKISSLSEEDLKNARVKTEEYSVTEPLIKDTKADLKGVCSAVRELTEIQNNLPSKNNILKASNSNDQVNVSGEGINIVPKGSKFSNIIDTASLPSDYMWGLDLTGETPVFSNDIEHINNNHLKAYNALQSSNNSPMVNGIFDGIGNFFGDVWETIKNGFIKVTHFVFQKVEEGIKIIINGANYAVDVIVKYAEQVWDIIEFVFKQIGIAFEELIKWLGELFSWEDIKRTEKVLSSYFTKTLKNVADFAGNDAANWIENKFDGIISQVEGTFDNLEKALGSKTFNQLANSDSNSTQSLLEGNKYSDHYHNNSVQCNYVFSYVANNNSNLSNGAISLAQGSSGNILDELTDAFNNSFPIEKLKESFEKIREWTLKIQDVNTFFDFTILSMVEALKDVIILILDGIKGFIKTLLKLTSMAIDGFNALISKEIDIPVISFLFKQLTGEKLTVLNLISLGLAIPATIIYKVVKGKAPFDDDDVKRITNSNMPWPQRSNKIQNTVMGKEFLMAENDNNSLDEVLGIVSAILIVPAGLMDVYMDSSTIISDVDDPIATFFGKASIVLGVILAALAVPTTVWSKSTDSWGTGDYFLTVLWGYAFVPIITDIIVMIAEANITRKIPVIGPGINTVEGVTGLILGIVCAIVCDEKNQGYNGWSKAGGIIDAIPMTFKWMLYLKYIPEYGQAAACILIPIDLVACAGSAACAAGGA